MRLSLGLAASVLALSQSPGEAIALKATPGSLNPAKAYILVEYKRAPNPFYGSPLAPKYVPQMVGLALGRYDPERGDIRGLGKAAAYPLPGKASPTEQFQNRPIVKTETSTLFLHEVEPDTYVVQGWGNTSFSLGSYRFDAKPGTIVDLGIVSASADWAEGEQPKRLTAGKVVGMILAGPFMKLPPTAPARVDFRPRNAIDIPIPANLPGERVVPVTFEPGATFGNYLGGLVNRVEGVNAKRDQTNGKEPAPSVPE